jgi:hypothetical protein
MARADENGGSRALAEKESERIGYDALDASGKRVGMVKAVWEDSSGRLAYVGIATGWLGLGRVHVVPARDAVIMEGERQIRMPFEASMITMGPDFNADYRISEEGERLIRAYYLNQGADGDADFNPDPGDPSLYTGQERAGQDRAEEDLAGEDRADSEWPAGFGRGNGSAGETGGRDGSGRLSRDWGLRTDAPMAYGEPIGAERDPEGPDRSLAGPESIETAGEDPDPDPEDRPFR